MGSKAMSDTIAKHAVQLLKVHSESREFSKSLPLRATHIGELMSRDIANAIGVSSWRIVHGSIVFDHPQGHTDAHSAILNVRDATVKISVKVLDAVGPASDEMSSEEVAYKLLHGDYSSQNLAMLHHLHTTSTHQIHANSTVVNSGNDSKTNALSA